MTRIWANIPSPYESAKNHPGNTFVDKRNLLNDAFFGGSLNPPSNSKSAASASCSASRSIPTNDTPDDNPHQFDADSLATVSTFSPFSNIPSSTRSCDRGPIHVTQNVNSRNQPGETQGYWEQGFTFPWHHPIPHQVHPPFSIPHQPAQMNNPHEEDPRPSTNPSEAGDSRCKICTEYRRRDEYPIELITSKCTHPVTDVCKQCMRTYIGSELSNRGTAAMSCPVCREEMSYFDVMRNAAPEDFNRYDQRMAIESLQNEPDFRWCPQRDCPGGQLQAYGDAEPKVTCYHCHRPFCFTHRVDWHAGLTCRQYDEMPDLARQMREAEEEEEADRAAELARLAAVSQEAIQERERAAQDRERRKVEEQQAEALVQSTARRCPKCQAPTERNGGCKHMTCKLF